MDMEKLLLDIDEWLNHIFICLLYGWWKNGTQMVHYHTLPVWYKMDPCTKVATRYKRLCVDQVSGNLSSWRVEQMPQVCHKKSLLWEINITTSTRDSCSKGIKITLRWTVWNSLKFTTRQKITTLKGKHDTIFERFEEIGFWFVKGSDPFAKPKLEAEFHHPASTVPIAARPPLEVPGLEVQRPDRENPWSLKVRDINVDGQNPVVEMVNMIYIYIYRFCLTHFIYLNCQRYHPVELV